MAWSRTAGPKGRDSGGALCADEALTSDPSGKCWRGQVTFVNRSFNCLFKEIGLQYTMDAFCSEWGGWAVLVCSQSEGQSAPLEKAVSLSFPHPVHISLPPLAFPVTSSFKFFSILWFPGRMLSLPGLSVSVVTGRDLLDPDLSLIPSLFLWLYLVLTTKAAINNHF